jgi:hypothetical protein
MSGYIWDVLEERDIGQLRIVVDKTWEDSHPRDLFDTSIDPDTGRPYFDIEQMCQDIDDDKLDWFMLRARVFYENIELGRSIVGGFLYEDAREVLQDGTAEDLMWEAMQEAKKRAATLKTKFMELEVDTLEV